MKYSEQKELVEGLRNLANFIEARGIALPSPSKYAPVNLHAWISETNDRYEQSEVLTKAKLQQLARTLGNCEKDYESTSMFKLRKKFGQFVKIEYNASREAVCEMKIVGYKEVDEYETKVIGKKQEPVYETICKPLLGD